jgi:hypothetical protein
VELASALSDVVTPPGDTPICTGAVDAVPLAEVVDGAVCFGDEQLASVTANVAVSTHAAAL